MSYLLSKVQIPFVQQQVMYNAEFVFYHRVTLERRRQILLWDVHCDDVQGVQVHHRVGAPAQQWGEAGPAFGPLHRDHDVGTRLVAQTDVYQVGEEHRNVHE